ncbi:MAG: gamma-glutamyl-gamma-aminobutyrate hydrolase family protein [Actinomycetota bacterium]|nr:gamma-glutamyl-gamma-aminobutyrate hydrolase family protein [Actinomycetota bacterium]
MSAYSLGPGESPPDHVETVIDVDPEEAALPDDVVGLVLTGGGDIDPALYGAEPHARTYNLSRRRDEFELNLLSQALDRDMPVLAICRGMQLLNVRLGGTLDQHITDTPGRLDHDRDRVRADTAHDVEIVPGTVLAGIFGETAHVNSHHHQGLDDVADDLKEIGWAPDGVLEAVVMSERAWVVGVQWHPEVMAAIDKVELDLFREFVGATEKYGTRATEKVRTA